jgi:hypothetical protein
LGRPAAAQQPHQEYRSHDERGNEQYAGKRAAEAIVEKQRSETCTDRQSGKRPEPSAHPGRLLCGRAGGARLPLLSGRILGALLLLLLRRRARRSLLRADRFPLPAHVFATAHPPGCVNVCSDQAQADQSNDNAEKLTHIKISLVE